MMILKITKPVEVGDQIDVDCYEIFRCRVVGFTENNRPLVKILNEWLPVTFDAETETWELDFDAAC